MRWTREPGKRALPLQCPGALTRHGVFNNQTFPGLVSCCLPANPIHTLFNLPPQFPQSGSWLPHLAGHISGPRTQQRGTEEM